MPPVSAAVIKIIIGMFQLLFVSKVKKNVKSRVLVRIKLIVWLPQGVKCVKETEKDLSARVRPLYFR